MAVTEMDPTPPPPTTSLCCQKYGNHFTLRYRQGYKSGLIEPALSIICNKSNETLRKIDFSCMFVDHNVLTMTQFQ